MARTLKEYPSVVLKSEDLKVRLDFVQIFGRSGPVHVEIGSGKGTFLINQGRVQPKVNFLGVEWARKYYRFCVDRVGRWKLENVRIIRTEAARFLAEFMPTDSVECFHIYFPDPWPKKRHNKRRFFNAENLEQLLRCLKAGGTIRAATDHLDYFEQIRGVIGGQKDRVEEIEFFPTAGAEASEWVGTNFERKYLKEQREIYTIAARKIQGHGAGYIQ